MTEKGKMRERERKVKERREGPGRLRGGGRGRVWMETRLACLQYRS